MDRIRTDIVGGMPFDAPDLEKLQSNYEAPLLALVAACVGPADAVLLGCEQSGDAVAPGWLWLGGELLYHEGTSGYAGAPRWLAETQLANPVTTELGETVNSWQLRRAQCAAGGVELPRWEPTTQAQLTALHEALTQQAQELQTALDAANARLDALGAPLVGEVKLWAGDASLIDWDTGLGTGALTGWAVADGRNNTIDLSGRFARGGATPGAQGGSNTHTLEVAQLPAHSHTATASEAGLHTHGVSYGNDVGGGFSIRADGTSGMDGAIPSAPAGAHSHTIEVAATGGGEPVDHTPAYTEVIYIQRIA